MRLELLWNPRLLCERLAAISAQQRRLKKLRNTPAQNLSLGHIDSLELLEIARIAGIKVIYDIGANAGTWALLAKAIIPDASVEAFEPLPMHHESFKQNCAHLPKVTLHPIALGAANTTMSLRVTDFSDASSFLPLTKTAHQLFGLAEVAQLPTPVRRLDDFILEKHLNAPDLIKLDVQGFEVQVLLGAVSALATAKAVIIEVSFVQLYEDQCSFSAVCSFLEHYSFGLHALSTATPLGKTLVQADALFMKKI